MHNDGIAIKVGDTFLDLKPSTTIQATFNNPIFNTEIMEGNYSLPFTIDWTLKNRKSFEFVEIVVSTKEFYTEKNCEVFMQGVLFYTGTIRVKKTSTGEYFATLLVTAPTIRTGLQKNSLVEADLGGDQVLTGANLTAYRAALKATTTGTHVTDDFVLFPVYNPTAISVIDFQFYASFINQYRSNQFNKSATGSFFNEPKCPFPYLVYVFRRILEEKGYILEGSFFEDSEILTLIIYNNYLEDDGNLKLSYNLQNHVPDIGQADFLIRLRKKFNLGYFFDHDRKAMEVIPLKELLSNPNYDDWTRRVGPEEEVKQDKKSTYTLKMAYDATDATYPGRYKPLDPLNIVATVETFADLPVATQQMGDDNEARLVRSLNQYWFVFLQPPFAPFWKYYSDNFYDLQVGDGEGRDIKIDAKISTLMQGSKTNQISGETQLVPEIRQECSTDFGDKVNLPFGFSLLFYRGIHDSDIGSKDYPMGIGHNYDLQETRIAEYSLKMDGADGIYETWWKSWLGFLINKKTVIRNNRLNITELKSYVNGGVGWKKKIRIDDVEFIQKSINVTFTMTGIQPAKVTLYSIPFTPSVPIPAGTLGGGVGGSLSTEGITFPGPRDSEGTQYAERIAPLNPDEGISIGAMKIIGTKMVGIDVAAQVRITYRYDEFHHVEAFTDTNIDYATDEFEITDHEFLIGDTLRFVAGAGLPDPLLEDVAYYLIEGSRGGDIFKISATRGGAAIDLSAPAGGVGGDIHSNDLGDIGLRVFVAEAAVVLRTFLENIDVTLPDPNSSGLISFFIESSEDVIKATQQKNLFLPGPMSTPFIEGEQTGSVNKFIKTTEVREVIMRMENEPLDEADYTLVLECAITE